jgi:hypothetical protein
LLFFLFDLASHFLGKVREEALTSSADADAEAAIIGK